MSLNLHNLKKFKKAKRKRKRVGRGNASGHGTYSTRGLKGQKSRAGASGLKRRGLRNLLRSVPKFKGQKRRYPKLSIVNIEQLQEFFSKGEIINDKKLFAKKLVRKNSFGIKILGHGNLTKKFTVIADAFSDTAKEAILKNGGKVIVKGRGKGLKNKETKKQRN